MNKVFTVSECTNKYPKIAVIGLGVSSCEVIRELNLSPIPFTSTFKIKKYNHDILLDTLTQLKNINILFISTFSNDEEGVKMGLFLSKRMIDMDILSIFIFPKSLEVTSQIKMNQIKNQLIEIEKYAHALINPETKILSESLRPQTISKTLSDVAIHTIHLVLASFFNKGANDISLEFSDLQTIMKGKTTLESIKSHGKGCAVKAMQKLVQLHNETNELLTASGVICIFKMHPAFSIHNINKAMEVIEEHVNHNIDMIFATVTDYSYSIEHIQITTFVSYFKDTHIAINHTKN